MNFDDEREAVKRGIARGVIKPAPEPKQKKPRAPAKAKMRRKAKA